jgi:polysaccharide export outer membrane protein
MNSIARAPIQIVLSLVVLSFPAFGQATIANPADANSQAAGAASSVTQPETGPTTKAHDDSYVIGNDDHLSISVWKEPDLTKSIPVRSDGKISLPLVGEMQASGRTPLQLESDISSRLRNYITAPEVTVIVEQINSKKYNILGYVGKPGAYALTLSTTVMDAIALAGGFKDFAKSKGVYILRQNPDGTQSRLNFNYKDFIKGKNLSQNVKVEPGDMIIVP